MFDIYSLAKPRVFMMGAIESGTSSETSAPDSVEHESQVLNDAISTISEEDAEQNYGNSEVAGRVYVDTVGNLIYPINVINAASDFGGTAKRIVNQPVSYPDNKVFRTEFRPKQGLHNLDFTTPAASSDETPSESSK